MKDVRKKYCIKLFLKDIFHIEDNKLAVFDSVKEAEYELDKIIKHNDVGERFEIIEFYEIYERE